MKITVLGAGLAGCEAALQLAGLGHDVQLVESKPEFVNDEVYTSSGPAELVCSNSLKSETPSTGSYLLKQEMEVLGSILLENARSCAVPAGASLAVNRKQFSDRIEGLINKSELIKYVKGKKISDLEELKKEFPADIHVVATGPLTDQKMLDSVSDSRGSFYDAIAPLISLESIDETKCFWGSRYGKGDPDFLNIPLNKEEYVDFVNELVNAEKIPWNSIEKPEFFERCIPIEVLAERGVKTLSFGTFRPVGFEVDGRRPWAVVQLRAENNEKSVLNLVGCQSRMKQGEQKRVFRLLPGLENAEFVRYGSVHRNSFVKAPEILELGTRLKSDDKVFIAGQLSGVEGYNESIFSGLWTSFIINRISSGKDLDVLPPVQTMSGGILYKMTQSMGNFQPVNANFSLIRNPNTLKKKERKEFYVRDGLKIFKDWHSQLK